MGKQMIETLKDGVRIMSIEARYLYSANKGEGYDTSDFWDNENKKKKIPSELYKVKMPYSLGIEKMYEIRKDEFKEDDYNTVYSDMVINVTFKGAAKKEKVLKSTAKGEIRKSKPKYIIKTYGEGKNQSATLRKVSRLETELNTKDLRTYIYDNGFVLDGNKYVYFMRSTSKSRGGNMLFVKEEYFYELLIEWARLGIVFDENQEIDVAGIKSYESLVLSGICGKIEIKSEEILLINDYESIFEKKASVTRLDGNNRLVVNDEMVEYHNSIWDGQSLLDSSKYSEFIQFKGIKRSESLKGKSFVLLRNLWFKSAAFNFNIQKYFADHKVTIEDLKKHGWTIAEDIKQIKLITTPNSLKILKIKECIANKYKSDTEQTQAAFEYWLNHIRENVYFGVVKAEHGMYDYARRCNSQILMALPLSRDDMRQLLNDGEFPYMYEVRNDENMFLMHLSNRKSSNNTMIYELASYIPKITRTEMYTNFKNDTLNDYKENWKRDGIKIPNSDFCVCVSNPLEMIQYACGVESKDWIRVHKGREAYCKLYDSGQELLATRNPCVCSGNILCLKNTENKLLNDYMILSENIVVVNSIESDIMERASGMDFDSDQMYLSSHKLLVEKAKFCETNYLTPVNKVARETKNKYNVVEDLSCTDTKIAKGKIGDIVNMGQVLQSYYWNIFFNTAPPRNAKELEDRKVALKRIYDKISMLSSASCVEIDRAKREFKLDTDKELYRLRKLGLLDNEDQFLADYIDYGKVLGVRKKTITEKELQENPHILNAYEEIEKCLELKKAVGLCEEQEEQLKENYKIISDFLIYKHKKNDSRAIDKIRKPLYFKYAFPKSVENSVFFEQGMNCPMDNLCTLVDTETPKKDTKENKIKIMELMNRYNIRGNDKHRLLVEKISANYSRLCAKRKYIDTKGDTVMLLSKKELFNQHVKEMQEIKLTPSTIVDIFNACYGSNQAKSHNQNISGIRKNMIDLIYAAHKETVLQCFKGTTVFGRRYFRQVNLRPVDEIRSA